MSELVLGDRQEVSGLTWMCVRVYDRTEWEHIDTFGHS